VMNELDFLRLEDHAPFDSIAVRGTEIRKGGRVLLRPKSGGDIFDLALDGKSATIESIEQDYDSRIHIAVVIDDDPGKELGMMRQPGHRFFFSPDEVEPL
jgi:hydrogenase maturation protease